LRGAAPRFGRCRLRERLSRIPHRRTASESRPAPAPSAPRCRSGPGPSDDCPGRDNGRSVRPSSATWRRPGCAHPGRSHYWPAGGNRWARSAGSRESARASGRGGRREPAGRAASRARRGRPTRSGQRASGSSPRRMFQGPGGQGGVVVLEDGVFIHGEMRPGIMLREGRNRRLRRVPFRRVPNDAPRPAQVVAGVVSRSPGRTRILRHEPHSHSPGPRAGDSAPE
jgi:hypothetical protein